ncbi:hypothetical protein [Mesoflavibacter zeaxanthinifaciens]|uniref:hypothetical protein n=1 Tax=Mesoflavibacter zeaxanthinifaciens TaxID=393060 RepID=UPI003A95C8E1
MNRFKKSELSEKNFFDDDNGIQINSLLKLIESSEFYENIIDYFELDVNDETLIEIPGARTMFTVLKKISKEFVKVDLSSNLKDIYFNYEDGFKIEFVNTMTNPYFYDIEMNELAAVPIHSGERDFFANLYDMDKYARQLISKGHRDILNQNLELLKTKEDYIKRYRLLHSIDDNTFYLRAIISEDRYYNYDNNLTFVIALLKLHYEMKASDVRYQLSFSEYSESFLRLYFRTSEMKELKGIGHLQSTLVVSNDEIKREALRFSTICSINFKTSNDTIERLYIKPKDIKTKVLSITHGMGPERAFENLEGFVKSKDIFENLCDEIKSVANIKEPKQIIHLVQSKIENSTTESIKKSKEDLKKVLLKDIKNTTQLLETFNKLMLLDGLDIDAKEYLRYIIYEALIDRK